jgi:hypothetical protein
MGRSSFIHFLSSHVGMGSRLHVVDGAFMIMSLTESSDAKRNSESEEEHESETGIDMSHFGASIRSYLIR